jgi:hypothetical protein
MRATGYRVTIGLLGLLCSGLLVIATRQGSELSKKRIASQRASDKMWLIRSDRKMAVEHYDVTNSVAVLSKLQMPAILSEYGDSRVLMQAVELERQKAIREIIQSLRVRTGQDYGEEPKDWIMTYGDASTREDQEWLEEWFKELRAENEKRLKALAEKKR